MLRGRRCESKSPLMRMRSPTSLFSKSNLTLQGLTEAEREAQRLFINSAPETRNRRLIFQQEVIRFNPFVYPQGGANITIESAQEAWADSLAGYGSGTFHPTRSPSLPSASPTVPPTPRPTAGAEGVVAGFFFVFPCVNLWIGALLLHT